MKGGIGMSRTFIFIVTSLLFDVAFSQPGQWFTRTPMPVGRQETAPAVLNGKIYIPAGYTVGGQVTTIVEVFDPATNSWSNITPVPEPLHHYGLTAANGRLYLLGAYQGSTFTPMNRGYVFIPDSNLWRPVANLPVARGAHMAVEFGGKIFLFGGIIGGLTTTRTDVYDPATNSWTTVADMPSAREHTAAARIDSLIYVIGGRIGSTNNNILEAYSPATNTWSTKPPMPTARGGLAAAAMNGRLYVFGGEIPGVFHQSEEYDPATNTWRAVASMLTPRHGMGAATVADSIYVIGGAVVQGFGATDVNELFTLPSLSADENAGMPHSYSLHQNYPNPFNPSTRIEYELPQAENVRLTIHDILGREIRTLMKEQLPAGRHVLDFSAEELPSGVYFYRIQTSRFTATRKMILIQ